MSTALRFLPFLRRGLVQGIATEDPLAGALPGQPDLDAWVQVEGQRVDKTVRLRSADAAVRIGSAQIVDSQPQPDSTDVEPNYLPFVELAAPDLPWLLTPAAPDARDRLRPWLVLVVVREQPGVSVQPRTDGLLPVLRIESPAAPASELPDLTDSWAWAHVQSAVPLRAIDSAVAASSPDVLARIICPRRLLPSTRYSACLVPAFEGGRLRGLGQTPPAGHLTPAWDLASVGPAIELPVYHQWSFATGPEGDFESLCRRLQRDTSAGTMGLHALDISDPGLVSPADEPVLLDMEGALSTVGAKGRAWPHLQKKQFQDEIETLLNVGIARTVISEPSPGPDYDPATQDPVVAPPAYGVWPAGVGSLPAIGWMRALNLNPVRRAAAGLGARVVRGIQESAVAAAWAQAGDLRATTATLNRGRLAAEIGRSLCARAVALADADLLQVTGRLLALLPGGRESVRATLAGGLLPAGLITAAYSRVTRPSTPLARDWALLSASPTSRLAIDHVQTMISSTKDGADPALAVALRFASAGLPDGAQTSDPTLERSFGWIPRAALRPEHTARLEETVRRSVGLRRPSETAQAAAPRPPAPGRGSTAPGAATDMSGVAGLVRQRLDAPAAARTSVIARVPALAGSLPDGVLPTRPQASPRFDDPLFWDLLRLGSSWILPGADRLGANRVRLLSVNSAFVGAFLIGANQQMALELLWRGFPVDLRATFFHRFWDYAGDGGRDDISELSSWPLDGSLAANMNMGRAQEAMTAIVVRGDLVRRYPDAHWFLQEASQDRTGAWIPVAGSCVEVSFAGALDRQTALLGFDLPPTTVRGDRANGVAGYFVAVEERSGSPRFGLDSALPGDFGQTPSSWDQLSWGHLAGSQQELDALTHARATGTPIDGLELDDGTTWGRNAAHMARAVWQRPFRMLFHADTLI